MKQKKKISFTPILIVLAYYLFLIFFVELRPEHLVVTWIALISYYTHHKSRVWMKDFLPILLYGSSYDLLRVYPKQWAGAIQVVWPYELEKFLFGFSWQGVRITPNEFFHLHPLPIFDVIGGLMYSLHVAFPMLFAMILWLTQRPLARELLWTLLLAGILSLLTYLVLPVAPPWYITEYGLTPANWTVPGNAAGLLRFDHMIGMPYYANIFSKNAWAFGAMPSMHAGYAFIVTFFSFKAFGKKGLWMGIYTLLMWFSIVYLNHHYVIDLIGGALYVLGSYEIVKFVFKKMSRAQP